MLFLCLTLNIAIGMLSGLAIGGVLNSNMGVMARCITGGVGGAVFALGLHGLGLSKDLWAAHHMLAGMAGGAILTAIFTAMVGHNR